MNNNEIKKIMELKKEVNELKNKTIALNHFLRNYTSSFTNEDSIKALERIEKYMNETINTRVIDEEKIQKISESIECNHELLIKAVLEYECPMCKRRLKHDDVGKNSKYVISCYYDYDEDESDINKIVFDAYNEEDACEELLLYFSNKQTYGNINIRRLSKWKEKS